MVKIVRKSAFAVALLLLVGVLIGFYLIWQNNRSVSYPARAQLEDSFNKGVGWLDNHQAEILNDENPMLWWMLKESADLTENRVLTTLYARYRTRYLDQNPHNPWLHLFYGNSSEPLSSSQLADLPYYNLFFLYGLSCDANLADDQVIRDQLQENFCDSHLLSPACVTHQMMGLRFMQRRACGNSENVAVTISALQDKIVSQLTWDVRVVDVYLQRVLMLEDSGMGKRVKPIWITRILGAQDSEGGWSDFQPLIPLGPDLAIGFFAKGINIESRRSGFHATAQGVLLMSLLLSHSK